MGAGIGQHGGSGSGGGTLTGAVTSFGAGSGGDLDGTNYVTILQGPDLGDTTETRTNAPMAVYVFNEHSSASVFTLAVTTTDGTFEIVMKSVGNGTSVQLFYKNSDAAFLSSPEGVPQLLKLKQDASPATPSRYYIAYGAG